MSCSNFIFRTLTLIFATSVLSSHANQTPNLNNFAFTTELNEYNISVYVKNTNNVDCGILVNYGDGTSEKTSLDLEFSRESIAQFVFNHKYPQTKAYKVNVKGVKLSGGLFSSDTPACEIISSSEFWLPFDPNYEKGSFNYEFMIRKEKLNIYMVKNIEGKYSFRPADAGNNNICLSILPHSLQTDKYRQTDQTLMNTLNVYSKVNLNENSKNAMLMEARSLLKKSGWTGSVKADCGMSGAIVAFPTPLKNIFDFGFDTNQAVYLFSIDNTSIENTLNSIAKEKAEVARLLEQIKADYLKESQNPVKNQIGALLIKSDQSTRRGKYNVCGVKNKTEDSNFFMGYIHLDLNFVFAHEKRSTANNETDYVQKLQNNFNTKQLKFNHLFNDINELYLNLNGDQSCDVVIDYPENILKLNQALIRDHNTSTSFGQLMPIDTVKDKFANQLGFANFTEFVYAKTIGANANQLSILKKSGVQSQSDFDKVTKDILSSGYANKSDLLTVMEYLQDYAEALKNNISVLKQKNQRIEKENLVREARIREEAKRQQEFVKEFPFKAVFTCGFNNNHMNIAACFVGDRNSVGTELELKNGGFYKLFKSWELNSLGNDVYGKGVTVPLKNIFSITAQNASENLILGLKIYNSKTDEVVFEKSVARFGVITINNR